MHQVSEISDGRAYGYSIDFMQAVPNKPLRMIVLMPAALPGNRANRKKRVYSRFTWISDWPDALVLAFADPALQTSEHLNGAWFIHPTHDFLKLMSDITREKAFEFGIPLSQITFYGSSLGGFGALHLASLTRGSKATVEVPQIAFKNWMPSAVESVEKHVLHEKLDIFEQKFPERVDVTERIKSTGYLPKFKLITNINEIRYQEHLEFSDWASKFSPSTHFNLMVTKMVNGHKVLDRDVIVKYI